MDISVSNINEHNIPDVKALNEKVDNLKQELYRCRTDLERLKNVNGHLETENQSLRDDIINQMKNEQIKIEKLKEGFSSKLRINETSKNEENQFLSEKIVKLTKINEELSLKVSSVSFTNTSDCKLNQELIDLRQEFNKVVKINETLENECERLQSDVTLLNSTNDALKKDLNEKECLLECKGKELCELKEYLEVIKEEKLILATELNVLKSTPADKQLKGNSLFGEVDVHRQRVLERYNALKNKYDKLKQTLAIKEHEYNELQLKNVSLIQSQRDDEKALQEYRAQYIGSLKDRIRELNSRIQELENRPETPQFITVTDSDLNWIHVFIEDEREKVRSLKKQMIDISCEKVQNANELLKAQMEGRILRQQLRELKMECDILKKKLEEKPEKIVNGLHKTSPMAPVVRFADDAKINDGGPSSTELRKIPEIKFYPTLDLRDPVDVIETNESTN